MPATLDTLSLELVDLIVTLLEPNQGLARYATISKTWQYAVERYTFKHPQSFSSELSRLKMIIGDSPRRIGHVKSLSYSIDLPLFSLNRHTNFERRREHQANLVAFRNEVINLWTELATWQDNSHVSSQGLKLVLSADTPSYRDRYRESPTSTGYGHERWAYPEHSLTLHNDKEDPLALPSLSSISDLSIATSGRRIHPTAIKQILDSLPHLCKLDLKIWPVKRKNKSLRAEMRNALASALESPSLQNLEVLRIDMEESTPYDHNYQTAEIDPDYPDGDHLCRAVCTLAQRSLRELYMGQECLISPVLWGFDRVNRDREEKSFPYLEKLQIDFALYTYDGRWYYTGDPSEGADHGFNEADHRDAAPPLTSDSEPDSCSSYNSEYADTLNEELEDELNGNTPYNSWRQVPDLSMFNPLIRALVSATLRMPRLMALRVRANNPGEDEYGISVECAGPGIRAQGVYSEGISSTLQPEDQLGKWRWVVHMGYRGSWDLPGDIQELMREKLGEEGEILIF
ncbi:hypothetical protein BDW59DRAFT_148378 [Aspergillus cavernicola]|uniref:F-box domain-containing protein n=1 Tax=Aspergillus cavernicola TaxID=176166 RepID=A0ABR4I7U9_9EURO